MRLQVVTRGKLIPVLDELENPFSARNHAAQVVVETARKCVKSPFNHGLTMEEEVLLPPFVRLGIGVRIVEVVEMLEPRVVSRGCFNHEVSLAIDSGRIPREALRPEGIWWEQIIPGYVTFGYEATTA